MSALEGHRQVDLGTYDIRNAAGENIGRVFVILGEAQGGTIEYWCLFDNFVRPSLSSGDVTFTLSAATRGVLESNATRAQAETAALDLRRSSGGTVIRAICDPI